MARKHDLDLLLTLLYPLGVDGEVYEHPASFSQGGDQLPPSRARQILTDEAWIDDAHEKDPHDELKWSSQA